MKTLSSVIALWCIVGLTHGVVVTIPELGDVLGTTSRTAWTARTIYQFLSIRFGQSPSGSRRFMPPEPFPAWNDVYNATVQRQSCPEITKLGELLSRPPDADVEDCLTLDIHTPANPENITRLLPVMVYIHGGGFYEGNARQFPPNYLLENDVMLVVIQYRLGPLGYLSLHTDGVPGNAGFMDQVLALQWINRHIGNFGGDNQQVTVFGQSAGACSISLHLMSPMVEPDLFQKAILQSGASFATWAVDKDPLKVARAIYGVLANDSGEADVTTMENVFKGVTVLQLFQATLYNYNMTRMDNGLVGKAVVQQAGSVKYLTRDPSDHLATGDFRTLPMMTGVTKHDGTYITTLIYDMLELYGLQDNDSFLRKNLTKALMKMSEIVDQSDSLVDILNDKYFKDAFNSDRSLTFKDIAAGVSDLSGVLIFKGQVLKQAKINYEYQPNSTYLYTLDYKGEHTRFGYGADTSKYPFEGGVAHSDDLIYLFPYHYELPLNEEDTKIAKLMSELWSSFAIDSRPTSSHMNVVWPNMQRNKNGPYLHINATSYVGEDFVECEYTAISNDAKFYRY